MYNEVMFKPLHIPKIEALPELLFPLAAKPLGELATAEVQLELDIPTNIEMGVE